MLWKYPSTTFIEYFFKNQSGKYIVKAEDQPLKYARTKIKRQKTVKSTITTITNKGTNMKM